MSGSSPPAAPGTDRPLSAYNLKRVVVAPRIWRGRRRAHDEPESARSFLELYRYSPAAVEIMALKAIDPHLLHRAALDGTSTIWDVGAAKGDGAADLRLLSGGTVHAFEPHPGSFAHIEARFADDDHVVPHPYGLGGADATATLELAGPGSSFHGGQRGDYETAEVAIRDLDAVVTELGGGPLDLVKINIEGGEYDLLDRMLEVGLATDVRYFLIQFHEWHPWAHLRRRRIRRALSGTHDEVWCYPWIWELWCARDAPHPPAPPLTPDLREAILAEVRARRAADQGA